MKWNKENKARLHAALHAKCVKDFGLRDSRYAPFNKPISMLMGTMFSGLIDKEGFGLWELFMNLHEIERVTRKDGRSSWLDRDSLLAQSKNHTIVLDPFFTPWENKGIKIPKDIAEKFLVIGVP